MLALHNVEKSYQNTRAPEVVLKDIHFEVERGEIFGILGRAHTGKTTLLRCIHGLERINSGSILFDNTSLSHLNEQALRLARLSQGMVFCDPLLLDSRTVYGNIALPLELAGMSKNQQHEKVRTLLQMTGMLEKANIFPKALTLGQRYRVSLARALVLQPKILLCDDITGDCDTKTTHSLLRLLRELHDRYHFTLVLATQNMEVVKTLCQRVAVLHQGMIVEQGNVKELFIHPKTDIAKEFVRSSTRLEMPTALRRRLKSQETEHNHPVFRLTLENSLSQEPLIAHAIQKHGLSMNILQAQLEPIRDEHIGVMVIELIGKKDNIHTATAFLEEKGLHLEALGYVS